LDDLLLRVSGFVGCKEKRKKIECKEVKKKRKGYVALLAKVSRI
jgi:hypothetical protein